MTWLVWRQHRNQAYIAAAALAAFAVLLLITGSQMASEYQSALRSCAAAHTCSNLSNTLSNLASPSMTLVITLTVVVPCVLGVFWGGPLVAREIETGTTQFAWMQSIPRGRWLTAKVGWALLAAAAWGGAVAALVTWWSSPVNALDQDNFQPSQFDIQGIVPIGYAVFAVALGIAAGALIRRTLPAMAVTLVVFTFLRLVVGQDFRDRYLTPVTRTFTFSHGIPLPAGSFWQVSSGVVGPGGQSASGSVAGGLGIRIDGISINPASLPSACRNFAFTNPKNFFSCLTARGYHGFITYQPAGRYWAFQGIETGIFIVLAAALIAVTAMVVLRRDA